MEDRYTHYEESKKRLLKEKESYRSLIIAFDFDNTIHDFHGVGDTYPKVIEALKKAKGMGHKLMLFTANKDLETVEFECISGSVPDIMMVFNYEYR